jgi:lysophospholipase L1-like esterase
MASRVPPLVCVITRSSFKAVALITLFSTALAAAQERREHWVATWSTSNVTANNPVARAMFANTPTSFETQTLRQIIHTAVGGSAIRIRLTNAFGTQAVTFGAAFVGLQKDGATLVPGSNHPITFSGEKSITVPEGAEALSDPVALSVNSQQNLTISLFAAVQTGPVTIHSNAFQTNFISDNGNFAADENASHFAHKTGSWFFLAAVDVLAPQTITASVIALGDSITDGASSTPDSNGRWTDVLARRLSSDPSRPQHAVLSAGIGGNRVLTTSPCWGENALARLNRDIFTQSGLTTIILFEGTNDIGQPDTPTAKIPPQYAPCLSKAPITADNLIAGYKQIIAQAHARGLKIIGATILPYQGFGGWTAQGEAKRIAVNDWIKAGGKFDGVIDFDAALADPRNPARLLPAYDSGDHLHPGQAGHKAMGEAVNLSLFQ